MLPLLRESKAGLVFVYRASLSENRFTLFRTHSARHYRSFRARGLALLRRWRRRREFCGASRSLCWPQGRNRSTAEFRGHAVARRCYRGGRYRWPIAAHGWSIPYRCGGGFAAPDPRRRGNRCPRVVRLPSKLRPPRRSWHGLPRGRRDRAVLDRAAHTVWNVGPLAIAGACVAWGLDNNLTRKVSLADPLQIVS